MKNQSFGADGKHRVKNGFKEGDKRLEPEIYEKRSILKGLLFFFTAAPDLRFLLTGHIGKLRELRPPHQIDGSDGAVSLLCDNYFRNIGHIRILIIIIVTV